MRLKMWKCISHRDASISRLPEEGPIRLHKTRQEVQGSGSGDSSIQAPDLAGVPRILIIPLCQCLRAAGWQWFPPWLRTGRVPAGMGPPLEPSSWLWGPRFHFPLLCGLPERQRRARPRRLVMRRELACSSPTLFSFLKQTRSLFSD